MVAAMEKLMAIAMVICSLYDLSLRMMWATSIVYQMGFFATYEYWRDRVLDT